jgi:hypothetical protein
MFEFLDEVVHHSTPYLIMLCVVVVLVEAWILDSIGG